MTSNSRGALLSKANETLVVERGVSVGLEARERR
jgi:hypothetical protein